MNDTTCIRNARQCKRKCEKDKKKKEETVPEDLLRARLRRLNGRTLGGSRCGQPPDLNSQAVMWGRVSLGCALARTRARQDVDKRQSGVGPGPGDNG